MKSNSLELPRTPEFERFEQALKHVLSVPKAEVMAEIERLHRPRKKRAKESARFDFGPRFRR